MEPSQAPLGAPAATEKTGDGCGAALGARGASRGSFSHGRFLKTKLCKFFADGRCYFGTACSFAHSEEELEERPDLSKTSLCESFMQGGCPRRSKDCPFAHGRTELRVVLPRRRDDPAPASWGASAGGRGRGAPAADGAAAGPPAGQGHVRGGLAEGRSQGPRGKAGPAPSERERGQGEPPHGPWSRAWKGPSAAPPPPPPPPRAQQPQTGRAPPAGAQEAPGLGGACAAGGPGGGEQPDLRSAREAGSPRAPAASAPAARPLTSPTDERGVPGTFVLVLPALLWNGQAAFIWQNRLFLGSAEVALRQAQPSHYED